MLTLSPTVCLAIATNGFFAVLQMVLLGLLITTYSIHSLVLSILSGGLWRAIHWSVTKREHVGQKDDKLKRLIELSK